MCCSVDAVRDAVLWSRTSPRSAEVLSRIGIQVTVATKSPRSEVWFTAGPSLNAYRCPTACPDRPLQLKLPGGQIERKPPFDRDERPRAEPDADLNACWARSSRLLWPLCRRPSHRPD